MPSGPCTLRSSMRRPELALAAFLAVATTAVAQSSARPGVRVQVTRIGSSGGWSGSAFVPIPPSRTTVTAGACPDYEGLGRSASGAVREVRVHLASRPGVERPLTLALGDAVGCGEARLEILLDDGSTLRPTVGSATVTLEAGDLHGRITGTITHTDGTPTTVVADFALRPRT